MSKEDSLDDILDDEPKAEVSEEPPVEEPDQGEAEDPPQEQPEPEPEPSPPPVEPTSEKETGLQAALTESRAEKRQLQEQITAMQTQMASLMQQPRQETPQEPQKLPDPLQDPEAYNSAVMQMMNQQRTELQLEFSERSAKQVHGTEFVEEAYRAAQAQGLVDQFRSTADPWGNLAKWHKDQKDLTVIRDAGGVDAYREQLRQEFLTEQNAQTVADEIVPAAPSLASSPNLGQRAPKPKTDDDSLKDILGNPHDL